jgi:hypothetical protein
MSASTYDIEQLILAIDSQGLGAISAAGIIAAVLQNGSEKTQVTNFPAVQPISGSVSVSNFPSESGTVAVSNFPASQPVTGTFFQATQPVSAVSLPLPVGAATSAAQTTAQTTLSTIATNTANSGTPVVSGTVTAVQPTGTNLHVVVDADAASPTMLATQLILSQGKVTIPAVAGKFAYLTLIEVEKYFTAANAASAAQLVVSSTNLPGNWNTTFGSPAGAVGVRETKLYSFVPPLKSSVVNTATTITVPTTTGISWIVNVVYYNAA